MVLRVRKQEFLRHLVQGSGTQCGGVWFAGCPARNGCPPIPVQRQESRRSLPALSMIQKITTLILLLGALVYPSFGAPPPADALHREDPRSAVTAFLEACHQNDYGKAAQYLDLSQIPERQRATAGPQLAKDLEKLLNAASGFDVLRLSRDQQGNPSDDADPSVEHVVTVTENGTPLTLELERKQQSNGPAVWLFAPQTVAKLPQLVPVPNAEAKIEARLPRFLVATELLETPLWKWIALVIFAVLLFVVFRLLVAVAGRILRAVPVRSGGKSRLAWLTAILDPAFVLLSVTIFRILEAVVAPSALTRMYVGRTLLLVVVCSLAWGLANLVDYVALRLNRTLDHRRRVVSTSLIYLGRRTSKTVIAIFAAILVLDNWGFNMTTIIAGLGVGGIAVALAAQQTIANIFGGISVIGDAPVMVGDFGSFGGVVGTVEDIGLRSVRVRTLNRTTVSIPNAAFAGMNLENYALRDKILFNPTFAVKRSTPKDQVERLMQGLEQMLKDSKQVEVVPTPVRITGFDAASYKIELFAYVLTADIDEYYRHEADLFLQVNEVVTASGVELA